VTAAADAGASAAYARALALHRQGRLDQAAALYEDILRREPQHFHALHCLGLIALTERQPARAAELLGSAILINPNDAAAVNHLGNALLELNQPQAAVEQFDKAISLKPDFAEAHFNRANSLLDAGRFDAAIDGYDAAVSRKPDFAAAHNNRGLALCGARRYEEAVAAFGKAMLIEPDNADAHHFRGNALQDVKQYEAAIASYEKAIELRPDYADAYYARGNALGQLQAYPAAVASYDRAMALKPHSQFLPGLRRHVKMLMCDWRDFDTDLAQIVAAIERGEPASMPFPILALSGSPALQKKAAQIGSGQCPPDTPAAAALRHATHDRVRIAYFSADFRDHPVSFLTADLIEAHDRSRFEVSAFSFGPNTRDAARQRMEKAVDRFIDVRGNSDRDIAQLARQAEVDIAVDLGGFTQDSRPAIFAARAAPLQVGYLGYPGTMAACYMDYLIADRILIPGDSQRHYSEKIAYLPNSYLANRISGGPGRGAAEHAMTREDFGLPRNGVVFCCFNSSYKITPETFDAWARILRRVDGSVLWLAEGNSWAMDNLRREAVRRQVPAERLIFAKRLQSSSQHLARQGLADLFLDTLPYSAHATAVDALSAGLPVLTCVGEAFAGRVGASLLTAVGLPELIASCRAQYEELAVDLASDARRLAEIKQRLAQNRLGAPLFDVGLFTRHIEAAYAAMHDRHCAGVPPDHLYVEP
jgi:protein O-GlcNAc transferase